MRTLSDEFVNSIRRYTIRLVTPDGELAGDDVQSLTVTQNLTGSGTGLTLGGTPAAQLSAVLTAGCDLLNERVTVFLGREGCEEEVCLGVFTVSQSRRAGDFTELTGYDAMYDRMESAYYPTGGAGTAKAVLAEIAAQAGVGLILPEDDFDPAVAVGTGLTLREAAGDMAALLGCNTRMDGETLRVAWFTDAGLAPDDDHVYADGLSLDTRSWTLGSLRCTVSTTAVRTDEDGTQVQETEEQTLAAGDGATGIRFSDPFMTQSVLDDLFARLGGLSCTGGTIDLPGDLRIEPGDLLTVRGCTLSVLTAIYAYDGGLRMTLSAPLESETEAGSADGPLTQSMERMTAQLGIFETLQAENFRAVYAKIDTVEADVLVAVEADLGTVIAQTVNADYIGAVTAELGYLTADQIDAQYVRTDELEAEVGRFGFLTADSAVITGLSAFAENVYVLLGGTGAFGALDTVHLTSENAVIDEAVVVNAMMDTVLAGVLTAGVIYTDYIRIADNENRNIWIDGGTIQFTDGNGTIREQLGVDASGTYNNYIWDENENLIWNALGLTEEGLTGNGAIIRDAAVAEDANIDGAKLNISSVAECLNADGSLTMNASQVTISDRTLDAWYVEVSRDLEGLSGLRTEGLVGTAAYFCLWSSDTDVPPADEDLTPAVCGRAICGTTVCGSEDGILWEEDDIPVREGLFKWVKWKGKYLDGHEEWGDPYCLTDGYLRERTEALQTELSVVQGQIKAKIWQTDIETAFDSLEGEVTTLADNYASVTVEVEGISERVASVSTTVTDNYIELDAKIGDLEISNTEIRGIVADVQQLVGTVDGESIESYTVLFCLWDSDTVKPPYDEDLTAAVCGTAICGTTVCGVTGAYWTEDEPIAGEGQYRWIRYRITCKDGSVLEVGPQCMTDGWSRDQLVNLASDISGCYSAIDQLSGRISLEVVSLNDAVAALQLGITQTQEDIISYINASADVITLIGDRISIQSDYFTLTYDGQITATGGTVGGWTIGQSALYNQTDSLESELTGTYIGTDGIRQYNAENGSYTDISNGIIESNAIYAKGSGIYLYDGEDRNGWINGLGDSVTVYSNGSLWMASDDVSVGISGGAITLQSDTDCPHGNLVIGDAEIGGVARRVMVANQAGRMSFAVNETGSMGLYNWTRGGWYCRYYADDDVDRFGNAGIPTVIYGDGVYLNGTSTAVTSDRSRKDEIAPLSANYDDLMDRLTPRAYTLKGEDGGKRHVGFVVDEVETAMKEAGLDPEDYGITDRFLQDGEKIGAIRYEELIPLLVRELQTLKQQMKELTT